MGMTNVNYGKIEKTKLKIGRIYEIFRKNFTTSLSMRSSLASYLNGQQNAYQL